MAPSAKTSGQEEGPVAASTRTATTRTATTRTAHQTSTRSASPPNQPTPARIRDEPPARSTRSWISAPAVSNSTPNASQRIPVDCPVLSCRAQTVHQHLPQLQYLHPRPGRAVHKRGYGNSNDRTSSQPSLVVPLRTTSQDDDVSLEGSNDAGNRAVTQPAQKAEEQRTVTNNDEAAGQVQLAQELEQTATQSESPSAEMDEVSEAATKLDHPTLEGSIHNDRTSTILQAPITPPPIYPLAAAETPLAPTSTGPLGQDAEPAVSPAPQVEFGDWLPGRGPSSNPTSQATPTPTAHVHTYDELIRPLVDPTLPPAPGMAKITEILRECQNESDLDMPSVTMRSPLSEDMWQFREEGEGDYDYETFMWQ